jgi:post-segregation antitoxin (ccd killing protein)
MTTLQFNLPDDLAQRAKTAGLLTDAAIQELLEDAIRRQAGLRLLEIAQRLHQSNIPPIMSHCPSVQE